MIQHNINEEKIKLVFSKIYVYTHQQKLILKRFETRIK